MVLMSSHAGVKKLRDMLSRPGYICAWRKECETLTGLDEMHKVERDTVEN